MENFWGDSTLKDLLWGCFVLENMFDVCQILKYNLVCLFIKKFVIIMTKIQFSNIFNRLTINNI